MTLNLFKKTEKPLAKEELYNEIKKILLQSILKTNEILASISE